MEWWSGGAVLIRPWFSTPFRWFFKKIWGSGKKSCSWMSCGGVVLLVYVSFLKVGALLVFKKAPGHFLFMSGLICCVEKIKRTHVAVIKLTCGFVCVSGVL